MDFRLIFVMDLLDGVVVHAKRGERDQYKPISLSSSIVSSSDPLHIVHELKPAELYIADLNRLTKTGTKTGDNRKILADISNQRDKDRDGNRNSELRIMLDYGITGMKDLKAAVDARLADNFVLGTETASMDLIAEASKSEMLNENRVTVSVSVDILNNEVLTCSRGFKIAPLSIIKELNEYPIHDVIVLDLDRVGTKSGIDFDLLARAAEVSEHNIIAGGGVKSYEEIFKLEEIGVKGALVATAIHDRSIPLSALRIRARTRRKNSYRFATDRMLGKLSRWLRILGHDTVYAAEMELKRIKKVNEAGDEEDNAILAFADCEARILLTRDKSLAGLARKKNVHCIQIKTGEALEQLTELLHQGININLEPVPVRCSECNARIRIVGEDEMSILKKSSYVPLSMIGVWKFRICEDCGRIYWEGSHWRSMREQLKKLRDIN
ncbi:MAG: hypothetical protein H0M93_00165 [Methanophagales archaeon]|nr:hypothetical protein [Methanophagales archaeon]